MQQKEKRPPKCNALQKRSNWLPASPLSIEYKGRFMAVSGKGQISTERRW